MIGIALFFVLIRKTPVRFKIELLLPFRCLFRNSWGSVFAKQLRAAISCPRYHYLRRPNRHPRPTHLRHPSPRLRPIPPPWYRVALDRLRKLGVIANCTLLKGFRKTREKTSKAIA